MDIWRGLMMLGIRETANYNLEGIDFDFRVCESPDELHQLILDKNKEQIVPVCWLVIVGNGSKLEKRYKLSRYQNWKF